MRRVVTAAVVLGMSVAGVVAAPASATCRETFDKFGIRHYTCAPPGGPAHSYLCIHDTCYEV